LSRGDRRVAEVLKRALENKGNWVKTVKAAPLDLDFYVARERSFDELLPWDFIEIGVRKAFLVREYERAMAGEPSPPCPMVSCEKCGICR
jgi:hypothetical protein